MEHIKTQTMNEFMGYSYVELPAKGSRRRWKITSEETSAWLNDMVGVHGDKYIVMMKKPKRKQKMFNVGSPRAAVEFAVLFCRHHILKIHDTR